jgi:HlyD family secretion protein
LAKVTVLVAVVGGGGWLGFRALGCGQKSEAGTPQFRVEQARVGPFAVRVSESGTLEAPVSVEVKSNVEGEVIELNVQEGDLVQAGQVLLRIDDEQIREEVQQAEANYQAAVAQRERARQETKVAVQRLDADLEQATESVLSAQAALEASRQSTIQQTGQAETDISTAKDGLERDRIASDQAQIGLQQLEITMNQLRAQENTAQIALNNARRELERSRELHDKKFLSKKSLEDAQEREAAAVAAYENAKKNVEAQNKSIESQKASIEAQRRVVRSRETTLQFQEANLNTLKASRDAAERQAAANLQAAKVRLTQSEKTIDAEKAAAAYSEASAEANVLRAASSLKTSRQRLGWTVLRAPMDGRVIQLDIEKGEIITSGRSAFSQSPALMTIADLAQMIVKAQINEVDMGQVALGQRAEISVSAYPNRRFEGRVRAIAPSGSVVDNVVRFEVEIEILGAPDILMPGMTGDVDIFVVDRQDVLQVPIEAVQEEDSYAVQVRMRPNEHALLKVGDEVTVETTLGKTVHARVSSLDEPERGGEGRPGRRGGQGSFGPMAQAGEGGRAAGRRPPASGASQGESPRRPSGPPAEGSGPPTGRRPRFEQRAETPDIATSPPEAAPTPPAAQMKTARLTLVGSPAGWRSGPVEFALVVASGQRIPSLSGRVTNAKSRFVEVVQGDAAAAPRGAPSEGGAQPGQSPGPGGQGPALAAAPPTTKAPIEVGIKNEAFYEVLSGVAPGTRVLVRPPVAAAGGSRPSIGG